MSHPADFESETETPAADQADRYQSNSVLSIAGLLLGIASAAAFWRPALLVVAAAGVLVSLLALRRISRFKPELTGRGIALAGLVLSLVFGMGAVGYERVARWRTRAEGRQFASQWFEYLRQNEPEKAHHLSLAPHIRQPLDDSLRNTYTTNPYRRRELENFVADPVVRTLLALGEKADVRFYSTEGQRIYSESADVAFAYAVTLEHEGRTKTFFVLVGLSRTTNQQTGQARWTLVKQVKGGYRPQSWTDEAAEPTGD